MQMKHSSLGEDSKHSAVVHSPIILRSQNTLCWSLLVTKGGALHLLGMDQSACGSVLILLLIWPVLFCAVC